jgi:hypothetical protein
VKRFRLHLDRQWYILGALSLLVLVGGSILGVNAIEGASKGPAFRLAATCYQLNSGQGSVRQKLGVIEGFGRAITGPVVSNTDGTGWASIQFDVIGSWKTGHAHVHAVRGTDGAPLGIWRITHGQINVDGVVYPFNPARTLGSPADRALCVPPTSTTPFHLS